MRLTFGAKHVGLRLMTIILMMLAMLAAFSCAAVDGWQHDNNPNAVLSEGDSCSIRGGAPGICTRIENCEPYVDGLRKKTIQYSSLVRCSFIGITEVICCPAGWERPVPTTSTTTSTTTTPPPTTTTTTTMRPIVIGDVTITGKEQFIDLSQVLRRTPTSTTRRPQQQQQRLEPVLPFNMQRPPQRNFNWEVPNPTVNVNAGEFNNQWPGPMQSLPQRLEPVLPFNMQRPAQRNFNWEVPNPTVNVNAGEFNNQWPGPMRPLPQQFNIPTDPQNNVRFPAHRGQQRSQPMQVHPDAEWYNPPAMVQFPSPPNSRNINPTPVFTDPFEPFKFRPGPDDPILVGTSTMRTIVGNELSDSLDDWEWRAPDTTTTGRSVPTTTATTSSPPSSITMSVFDKWLQDAIRNETTSTSAPVRAPLIAVAPFSITTVPTTTTTTTTKTIDTLMSRNQNTRPSQVACREYRGINPSTLTFHILDGVPVEPGDYPHMGGLIYPEGGGTNVDLRCGSSLISERYVMTAAHCVNDPVAQPTSVRFGVVVWNSTEDGIEPYDAEIENILLHPDYVSHLNYHDIALIRLRRNVPFGPYIRPACLNADVADVDSAIKLVVIGWGVTNVDTKVRSTVLLMTNVTTVGLQECNATHQANGFTRNYRQGLNGGQYCAFDPEFRKDACQADSGGPLQLVENKQSTIVGVVSFGNSCATAIPSVYARVAFYLTWIESVVWPS